MSFSRLRITLAVLFLALASLRGAEAGLNRWTPIGPSASFLITEIAADPHDPAILYAKTFNTGVWRSGDGGDSWVSITEGLPGFVNGFAVDAVAPGVLYVTVENLANGALAVWSSADRGDTWTRVFQGPPTGGIARVDLVVDPFVSGTLYQIADGQVSKSTDGGRTWSCFSVFFPTCSGPRLIVTGFTVDPQSSERLYATNNLGLLYMSTDGGVSWTDGARIQPLFGAPVNRLAVSPTDPEIVYAWLAGGGSAGDRRPCFARSDDRGESWSPATLADVECGELSVDPEDGQILRILVGPEHSLWTSRDGGETWTQGRPAPDLGKIQPDPAHPGTLLLAGSDGLFRSQDEGAHWSRWGRRGFNNTGLRVLLGSAEAPGVLYASLSSQPQAALATNFEPLSRPLQKSADAGGTWTELPLRGVAALAIDPRDARHLYAINDLFDNGRLTSRVHESADGGLSWRLVKERPFTGFTSINAPPLVTGLVVDPLDSRVLFASTSLGSGLFRSADGGRTWSFVTRGLPVRTRCGPSGCPVNATSDVVFDRNPRILYVIFDGVVYRSADRGESWGRADSSLPPTIVALAADPERSGVLYAAGAIPTTSAGFVSAVFRSVDRGRHWARAAAFASPVLDLTVSRAGVYAATAKDGVYHSTVPGNWVSYIVGLPGGSANLLAYDPLVPARVYAGTPQNGAYVARLVNP